MKYIDIGDFGDADSSYDGTFDYEFPQADVFLYNQLGLILQIILFIQGMIGVGIDRDR